MKLSLFAAALVSSLVFVGCATKVSNSNTTPVITPEVEPQPAPTPTDNKVSQTGWVEHTAGVWTFKLPPQFVQMEEPEGIDAFYKSDNDKMLVAMNVDKLTEPMDVDHYASAFMATMAENGAMIVGDLKGASTDEAKMGGMETDAFVFAVGHKSLIMHFVAVGNGNAYNFECGTGSLLPKQNKANITTCLEIEKTVKLSK